MSEETARLGMRLDKSTLSRFEQGEGGAASARKQEPDLRQLFVVAAALGVSPVALLMPSEDVQVTISPALTLTSRNFRRWLTGQRPLEPDHTVIYNKEHVDGLEQTDEWRELQSVAAEAVWLAQDEHVLYAEAMTRSQEIRRRLELVLARVALKAQAADPEGAATWQRRQQKGQKT